MAQIAVVAGNEAQFAHWCRERGLSPHNRHVVCVRSCDRLRGRSRLLVVRVGTYYDRRDWRKVEDSLWLLESQGKLVLAGDSVCVRCGAEITRPGSGWWRAVGDDTLACDESRSGLHEAPGPADG